MTTPGCCKAGERAAGTMFAARFTVATHSVFHRDVLYLATAEPLLHMRDDVPAAVALGIAGLALAAPACVVDKGLYSPSAARLRPG